MASIADAEAEVKELKRELAEARAELGALRTQGGAQPRIRAWEIDRKNYRAVPVLSDGRPAAPLNLRPLFEMYRWEANS